MTLYIVKAKIRANAKRTPGRLLPRPMFSSLKVYSDRRKRSCLCTPHAAFACSAFFCHAPINAPRSEPHAQTGHKTKIGGAFAIDPREIRRAAVFVLVCDTNIRRKLATEFVSQPQTEIDVGKA